MISRVDHVVILVADLASATADFRNLGFSVTPGGSHTGGSTHNALVAFADGAYLELIAFTRPDATHRWHRHTPAGPGIIDFALLPTDPAADIAGARARGVALAGPVAGGRLRPDGVRLEWQLGLPESPALPFLCGDVTPRSLRVPGGAATDHPNGVSSLAEVTVAVAAEGPAADLYAGLLDVSPAGRFVLGETAIVLAEAASAAEPAIGERLRRRGPGPAALALRTPAVRARTRLDPALCCQAELSRVPAAD